MIVLMRTTTYIFIILVTNDKKQLKPQIKQKKKKPYEIETRIE